MLKRKEDMHQQSGKVQGYEECQSDKAREFFEAIKEARKARFYIVFMIGVRAKVEEHKHGVICIPKGFCAMLT